MVLNIQPTLPQLIHVLLNCFPPTEAPAFSALQPLLGLPVTGSSGGYAHQTTLRLFSLLTISSYNQDLPHSLSSEFLEFMSSGALGGPLIVLGVWPGGGAPWSRDGRSREEEEAVQCSCGLGASVDTRSRGRQGGRCASTTLPPAWDAPPGRPTTLPFCQAKAA